MYMNIYEGWNTPAWKERNNTYTHSTVQGWEENSAFSLEISKAMESSQEYSNAGDILYAQAKDPQTDVATEQTLLIYMLLSEKFHMLGLCYWECENNSICEKKMVENYF